VVERERPVFEGGPLVDALLFTTLGTDAPKIALNVELGDSAHRGGTRVFEGIPRRRHETCG